MVQVDISRIKLEKFVHGVPEWRWGLVDIVPQTDLEDGFL